MSSCFICMTYHFCLFVISFLGDPYWKHNIDVGWHENQLRQPSSIPCSLYYILCRSLSLCLFLNAVPLIVFMIAFLFFPVLWSLIIVFSHSSFFVVLYCFSFSSSSLVHPVSLLSHSLAPLFHDEASFICFLPTSLPACRTEEQRIKINQKRSSVSPNNTTKTEENNKMKVRKAGRYKEKVEMSFV